MANNIFEKVANKITNLQVKYPFVFIMVFALIALILVPGVFRLVDNVEPSLEKVLPQDVQEVKTMNDMRSAFGADMMYLVVYQEEPIADVRDPRLLTYVDLLSQKLRTLDFVVEVNNMADLVLEQNSDVMPLTLSDSKEIVNKHPMSYMFTNSDYSFTVIRIQSDTGANAKAIKNLVDEIKVDIEFIEEYNPGSRIEITGFNAIDKATFEVIMSDFAYITIVSMALVMIVVLITFKSLIKGMLPMVVVMNALLWTMGLVGYFGMTITVISMVSAAMIMGLGIDFGIHVVHSYFGFRKKYPPKVALKETMKELLRAMVAASLTTIAGFLALLFGVLPAMKMLGIILGIGILTTLIGSIFLLPVIVYLYDINFVSK